MRNVVIAAILIAASAACARTPHDAATASPTAPSTAVASSSLLFGDIGGVSGPMDANFPPRNDLFTFFSNADDKYRGMGRAAVSFFIDREGIAVWMQEYIRYRVNGCDHSIGVTRVVTQIGGGAAGAVCGSVPDGAINLPSRADSLAALIEFNATYQRMGRGASQMFIDLEGAAIWIQEYLRYRLNSCDATTAQSKVFVQIDGGAAPATCFVACNYTLSPSGLDTVAGSVSSSLQIRPIGVFSDPRSCGWTASSDASWLTIASNYQSGNGFTEIPYSIARNDGNDRRGTIRFAWPGGGASFVVYQPGTPFASSLVMVDSFAGANVTDECRLRSTNTTCYFTVATNLPGGGYTYNWEATYDYGGVKRATQNNSSNQFSLSDSCGGSGASTEGAASPLTVRVVITDDRGNTITVERQFTIRYFSC